MGLINRIKNLFSGNKRKALPEPNDDERTESYGAASTDELYEKVMRDWNEELKQIELENHQDEKLFGDIERRLNELDSSKGTKHLEQFAATQAKRMQEKMNIKGLNIDGRQSSKTTEVKEEKKQEKTSQNHNYPNKENHDPAKIRMENLFKNWSLRTILKDAKIQVGYQGNDTERLDQYNFDKLMDDLSSSEEDRKKFEMLFFYPYLKVREGVSKKMGVECPETSRLSLMEEHKKAYEKLKEKNDEKSCFSMGIIFNNLINIQYPFDRRFFEISIESIQDNDKMVQFIKNHDGKYAKELPDSLKEKNEKNKEDR